MDFEQIKNNLLNALGQLIALYERTVAIYAEFIHINAFHQPGVQAYKLAAKDVLALREKLFSALENRSFTGSAADFAALAAIPERISEVASLLDKAALNDPRFSRKFTGCTWEYTAK